MTQNPQQRIKLCIKDHAHYFRQEIGDDVLRMYAADLADLSPDAVEQAYRELRLDPDRKPFLPTPAEVRARITGGTSEGALGVEVATRIWSASGRRGAYWSHRPDYQAEMLRELGEVGVEVVRRWGGWEALVTESNDAEPGTLRAQLRESAKSVLEQARKGQLHQAPALPGGSAKPALESVSNFLPNWAGSSEPEPNQRVEEARSHDRKHK